MKNEQLFYIYKITNIINQKCYIGQTINPKKRWNKHKNLSKKPKQVINWAINRYGINNFYFEVIATSNNKNNINYLEEYLIKQYNCLGSQNGYNISLGVNSTKSEEWKQYIQSSEIKSEEEINIIKNKRSSTTLKQIKEYGHPAKGCKKTEEQKKEISINSKNSWDNRRTEKLASGELKCNAPECNKHGFISYLIINDIRYCEIHGWRLKKHNSFDKPKRKPPANKGKKISEETRNKLKGKKPPNKIKFTDEQIKIILEDTRPIAHIAKEFKVSPKVISRVKIEFKS